jgi:hypothetical protein
MQVRLLQGLASAEHRLTVPPGSREDRASRTNGGNSCLRAGNDSSPLAGVVFVVLAVIALFTAAGDDFLAEPSQVADYYVDNSERIIVAEIIGGFAIFAFFWFVGAVRNRLRVPETPEGGLPALAFGGGLRPRRSFSLRTQRPWSERFEPRRTGRSTLRPRPRSTTSAVSSSVSQHRSRWRFSRRRA